LGATAGVVAECALLVGHTKSKLPKPNGLGLYPGATSRKATGIRVVWPAYQGPAGANPGSDGMSHGHDREPVTHRRFPRWNRQRSVGNVRVTGSTGQRRACAFRTWYHTARFSATGRAQAGAPPSAQAAGSPRRKASILSDAAPPAHRRTRPACVRDTAATSVLSSDWAILRARADPAHPVAPARQTRMVMVARRFH